MKQKIIVSLVALGLVTAVGTGLLTNAYAQSDPIQERSPLVQKLIEKFNLNADEVDKVIEEVKAEHHAKRQAELSTKLDEAVAAGKINADQKAKILAKLNEMKNSKEAFSNLSMQERKAKMEQHKADMEAFEKELGVNLKDIIGMKKGGPGGHQKGGF